MDTLPSWRGTSRLSQIYSGHLKELNQCWRVLVDAMLERHDHGLRACELPTILPVLHHEMATIVEVAKAAVDKELLLLLKSELSDVANVFKRIIFSQLQRHLCFLQARHDQHMGCISAGHRPSDCRFHRITCREAFVHRDFAASRTALLRGIAVNGMAEGRWHLTAQRVAQIPVTFGTRRAGRPGLSLSGRRAPDLLASHMDVHVHTSN